MHTVLCNRAKLIQLVSHLLLPVIEYETMTLSFWTLHINLLSSLLTYLQVRFFLYRFVVVSMLGFSVPLFTAFYALSVRTLVGWLMMFW